MDNRIAAARDAQYSEPEQQNIMHSAIVDWENDDEEGTDTTPEPEAITMLFERKPPRPISNLSLLTKLLLQSKEKRQEHNKSSSKIRRLMLADEDEHCTEGGIRRHIVQERKGNSSPFVQESIRPGPNWPPGELLNDCGLEATYHENVANDQGNSEEYKSIQPGKEIVFVGHCNDSLNPRTISLCVKDPSGNIEWENHQLDSVQRRPDFQSAT
ncbi:hypothetical protein F1880_005496 [Penicillium rolfsii]|nr:hypothetical protein F1880_005496 [Penicillium rolfsii]